MSACICVVMTVIIAVSIGPSLTDSLGFSPKGKIRQNQSISIPFAQMKSTAVALICTGVLFCLTGQNCPKWKTELFLFIYS